MTARTRSASLIAQRMLHTSSWSALVRVGDRVEPRHVAADIHETLAKRHPRTCWIHAQCDLSPALRFALDQPDHPLVVTTNASDWSPFDSDRAWVNRGASLVCVLSYTTLANVPSQVATMFLESLSVRRSPVLDQDEELPALIDDSHKLISTLLDESALEIIAHKVGVDWSRINASGPPELTALRLVREALRCDLFDRLAERLHDRYPRHDTSAHLRSVRSFYQRLES